MTVVDAPRSAWVGHAIQHCESGLGCESTSTKLSLRHRLRSARPSGGIEPSLSFPQVVFGISVISGRWISVQGGVHFSVSRVISCRLYIFIYNFGISAINRVMSFDSIYVPTYPPDCVPTRQRHSGKCEQLDAGRIPKNRRAWSAKRKDKFPCKASKYIIVASYILP